MTTLQKFLWRRSKIKDIASWARDEGLTTYDELVEYCTHHHLQAPAPGVVPGLDIDVKTDGAALEDAVVGKPKEQLGEEQTETWHTPAAERPLAKAARATRRPKAKAKKASTKKTSSKK